ncbi:MAG: hypothetical protein LBQ31_05030 [Bacteroidales bacterium]|jgi:hypothetical protein|nr:hypothetical protein [Bacteroidales bacterium]
MINVYAGSSYLYDRVVLLCPQMNSTPARASGFGLRASGFGLRASGFGLYYGTC